MNTNEILRILKHNLEVMKNRPMLITGESDQKSEMIKEVYKSAVEDIEKSLDQIIEDGEITWLSDAYDDRVNPSSLDRNKWGAIQDADFDPFLEPALQRTKEEIHEQLKESIDNILKDEVCETEDEAEERANEELELQSKEDTEFKLGEADYWSEFQKQVKELGEKFHSRLDDLIEEFLEERDLTWLDFKKHSTIEITNKWNNQRNIYYRDEKIIVAWQAFHNEDTGIIAEWKIVPIFRYSE